MTSDAAHVKLLDTWRVHQLARALSLRTVNERQRVVSQFAAEVDMERPHAATTSDVASWLARGQWTGSTRHTYWTHLNAWFTWLCLNGYRADNPMTPLRAPKRPRYEPHPVSRVNVGKLLAARMWPTTRAYLLLALYAGLRVSEIAAVRGEDFDLTAGIVIVKGKGGRVDTLPLHPKLVALAATMPRSGWWFRSATRRTGHVASQSVGEALKDLMLRCGVRGSAHSLRHSFGTNLVVNGADARTAQTLLRHASLQSTQIYVDASDTQRLRAIQRLDYRQAQAMTTECYCDDEIPAACAW